MSKVRTHQATDLEWNKIRASGVDDRVPGYFSETELESTVTYHERGSDDELQLIEIDYLPNAAINVHAHDEDEIIYIVKGEMRLGTRVLGEGSSVFIKGRAFYSFQAGPEGLRMLNFRPKADFTLHLKSTGRVEL